MSLNFNFHMDIDDLAFAVRDNPEELLDLLAELSVDRHLVDNVACAHALSKSHMMVAPFLRQLAEALEAVEADHASE
jgi:hypothetical protein